MAMTSETSASASAAVFTGAGDMIGSCGMLLIGILLRGVYF
jgi:hypothetical protein